MKNIVMLQDIKYFNVKQILESGQIFRYEQLSDESFIVVAKQKAIKLSQQTGSTSVMINGTTRGEFEEIWSPYFDLESNYEKMTTILSQKDEHMEKAIQFGSGIRILKQEPWEMLISFIISQNKAIPHIRQCIENISKAYGEEMISSVDGEKLYYTFPTVDKLIQATEEELRGCKVGFRAPYIIDACQKVYTEEVKLRDIFMMPVEEARMELMKIKGVGPKIADCILLFAYGKGEVFPTDVWIKRVMEGLYFDGKDMKLKDIQQFAADYFGEFAGYAQQYLFFYARENSLFTRKQSE